MSLSHIKKKDSITNSGIHEPLNYLSDEPSLLSFEFSNNVAVDISEEVDIEGAWCRVPALFKNQRIYIPEQFTPTYSYPLIVCIHHGQQSAEKSALEKISQQNYLGLSINLAELQAGETVLSHQQIEELVVELLADFQQIFKVNQKQIYLLGEGPTANLVLDLGIKVSAKIAGLLILNPVETGAVEYHQDLEVCKNMRVGIVDDVIQEHNWQANRLVELRSLPFKQLAVFQYDDLMVHYNDYEVLNRFVMSGIEHVVW